MVNNLFLLGRIRTTPAKAKEVRSMAEKMITLAVKGGLANFRSALAHLDDKYVVRQGPPGRLHAHPAPVRKREPARR
jgi:large subunit ribosomal protein L17